MRLVLITFMGIVIAALSPAVAAQVYPAKPIRVIVPFAPGGAGDLMTRLIAVKLSSALGQPVIVDNHGGAGGTIGLDAAARAAPDIDRLNASGVVACYGVGARRSALG